MARKVGQPDSLRSRHGAFPGTAHRLTRNRSDFVINAVRTDVVPFDIELPDGTTRMRKFYRPEL